MQDKENFFNQALKQGAQILLKKGLQWLLKTVILPFLPYIIVFFVIFGMLLAFVGAVYSAFPVAGILTAENKKFATQKDKEEKAKYQRLADFWNSFDNWLVDRVEVPGTDGEIEPIPRSPFYPGKGIQDIGMVADPEHTTQYLLNWGQIYSVSFYWASVFNKAEIPDDIKEEMAKAIHPYFYYRLTPIVRQVYDVVYGWQEPEKYYTYRLIEAYTIQGHYQFYYKWKVTEYDLPNGNKEKITEQELDTVQLVGTDRWKRLKDVIKEKYEIKTDKDIEEARQAVWEAGEAYYREQEWLAWLEYAVDSGYLSSAGIPPDLRQIFLEAEQKFGVPWWFLAGVSLRESSFRVDAVSSLGAIGLMQVMPYNFEHYAPLLGFSYPADTANPRAQVFIGAYMLASRIGDVNSIDWQGDGWKTDERIVKALLSYGGYDDPDEIKKALSPPHGYVYDILRYAEQFKNSQSSTPGWPLPKQYTTISSPFGPRIHPRTGKPDFHEGIDLPAPKGTPVYSVADGEVIFAGWAGDAGQMIKIKDAFNTYHYLHLSKIDVKTGDKVTAGQKIGEVGNTGVSVGANGGYHLDIRIKSNIDGRWINPLEILTIPKK
ncbi:M23 family metallopeptidase [Carboxydothermus ferrireducens]|uniref:Murein DD-endopeptidase MepM/ murein hydrolase activator NlpD n=1 Tax=Carboxydothermus ferrireducens DSM 11255 TaxID=1119529 RepID=A0ABX2R7I9_9THEO|nr:M23 family metallopeptidase [Carboxydothermus ferrireducens]NYE57138.1 murein DD-endopeptidase MepM/ murein hydrolase activator NlpD [Carboxydothermus ferrireducens DSM 11255]